MHWRPRWRRASMALLVVALEARVCVASAQSTEATICRGSVARKAIVARVIDGQMGGRVGGLLAHLEAQRPDTVLLGDSGIAISAVLRRMPKVDASGQLCFENLRAGEYRFETGAVRWNASHQAIIVHLSEADTMKAITLRYRPFGRLPEEDSAAARMLNALDENRRRWLSARPAHYLVQVKRDCASCVYGGPPPTYEVENGVAVATIDVGGVRHVLGEKARRTTVDSVFDALRGSILDERRVVKAVEYDERFGWPRLYEIETGIPELSGGQEKFTIERFDVLR
jgi:hypothetical protein